MVEGNESFNLTSGCFINLCEIGNETTTPRRKNATPCMNVTESPLKSAPRKAIACSRQGGEDEGNNNETACHQSRQAAASEQQKRKTGVVLGVDPKVDEYLNRVKRSNDTSEIKCSKTEAMRSGVGTRN